MDASQPRRKQQSVALAAINSIYHVKPCSYIVLYHGLVLLSGHIESNGSSNRQKHRPSSTSSSNRLTLVCGIAVKSVLPFVRETDSDFIRQRLHSIWKPEEKCGDARNFQR
ncbi:indolepyruvate ferredoxin oxidoreductase subunit alpha [Anopheles sinensis]|uniref:Indolepyruvate ferredoxin oxidoreductase subunit alpha n=1 Tax=Anopheles sinensis TaxID=74873 RepID=A0A084W1E3_ANOSI|nr:indolepyruvate ferredoxin oxidoreductase subunit alpha [Anopheles sinensis]